MARYSFPAICRFCTPKPLHHQEGMPRNRPYRNLSGGVQAWSWIVAIAWISLCLPAPSARGQIINTVVGPQLGANYLDTLYAYSANSNYASPCPWVTAGWNTWMTGGGGGGQTWSLNWATGASYTN